MLFLAEKAADIQVVSVFLGADSVQKFIIARLVDAT
jgi:hypothetical protein